MFKKGIAVTAIFITSTAIQLLSQIVITRIFGASIQLDVFFAAVAVPTLLVTVIYATFNDAFLPLYGEVKTKQKEEAELFFSTYFFILTAIAFVLALVLALLSQPLAKLLYSSESAEFIESVSTQMRYLFMVLPFAVMATLSGTYYYAHKQFVRFPVAQTVGNFVNLLLILAIAQFIGIWALIIGFVLSTVVQIFIVFPKLTFTKLEKINIIPFFYALIPLVIGSIALRSDTLLIRSFGVEMGEGYLVYLNLITKIFSLSTSVLTIGIQVTLLPHLVEYIAEKKYELVLQTVLKTKIIAIAIACVTSVGMALISPLLINWLFVGGKFTQQDANTSISLIPFFVLPAIGWGINSIFFQPLVALKKQLPLGLLNLGALIAAWIMGYFVKNTVNPLTGIITGLLVLLFTGIIGSELLWQYYKKELK